MTDPLGQSQVLPYLKGLTEKGYEFHLISFEKDDKFKRHKKHIQSICDESGIVWHPQDYRNEGGLKKTIRQVRKMKKVANYLHQKHRFDIVHCRSYISALIGMKMKQNHGVKFIFDMRGFWADERIDGGIWNLNNKLYKTIYNYFKRKEIQFFNHSDYTISLTENGKNEICSWPKIKEDIKIKVIPCCVDLNKFDPKKIDQTHIDERKLELGFSSKDYVLGYVGSIGTWYMLDEMMDYFKVLSAKKENTKFLFVSGESKEKIIAVAKEKGICENELEVISVLHHEVPLHISLFDASIFFIRATYSKKASSPTKQGEIMAMGVPLVCNSGVGDTDEIVRRYNAGNVINKFNEEAYASNIIDASTFDTEKIKAGADSYFSLTEGVERYAEVYKSVYA
ncbi:MAG: glycosyltransferase [Crocinitomicaceae bacterium]|nr:glycosyltransferase [Crocinitomicaceae bacterium]